MTRVRVGQDGAEADQTLLMEWPLGAPDPISYWLATLPRHTPLRDVVAAAKGRWPIEQNYRDLKQEVGLGDYEGRGWRGFHHHVTLTFAAYGFLVMRRCQQPEPAGGRAGILTFPLAQDPANPPVRPGPRESAGPTGTPCARIDPDHAPTPDRGSRAASPALPLLPDPTSASIAFPAHDRLPDSFIGLMEQ